jgi:hypothetical protein
MTLLLTLGFLCVMLMLVLSLALASRTERRAAAASADLVRTRLVAQSALGEAEARLRLDYAGVRYPADQFYLPSTSSSWAGRRYLASGDSNAVRVGIDEALAVKLAGRTFTPSAALSDNAGWIPMLSTQSVMTSSGLVNQTAVVGRYAYLIIDESGMIDPGAVVQQGMEEPASPVLTGASVAELSLAALGFSNANAFVPSSPGEEFSGLLPLATGRWFDMSHLSRTLNFSQSEMNLAARTLFPFSYDQEQFWRDRDEDGVYSAGEEADRLDVRSFGDVSQVYHTLVGPLQDPGHLHHDNHADADEDDCQWLKDLDNNPWFVAWKNQAFAAHGEPGRTIRAREQVAAQVAVNIADYADPDSTPTLAYLDSAGQIHLGTSGGTTNVAGVERTWGLSEVAMRIETDATEVIGISGGGDVAGTTTSATDVPFTVAGGSVNPTVAYQVTATILGAQLSLHQGSDTGPLLWWCPVTTNLTIGGQVIEPWGDLDTAASDIQDFNYPKHYQIANAYPAGTPIVFKGKFWNHPYANGRYNTTVWECFRQAASNVDTAQIKILRNNDPVPNIGTSSTIQNPVSYYLQDYVEAGKISLQPNQAIYLFETRLPGQGFQDFQDLVVLITLFKAPEGSLPSVLTKHAVSVADGTCNINPSNSPANEFYLTKPDGSQITRDNLLTSRARLQYTGNCTRLHWKPKGNGNDNYIMVNGKPFQCQNGKIYDLSGTMAVHLYNDNYGTNGAAMGHWWLGVASSSDITITVGGVTYTETITPPTPPPPPLPPAPPADAGTGSSLRLRAGFKGELSYPWSADGDTVCPPSAVEITYRVDVATATGRSLTRYATKTFTLDRSAVADGGTLMWNNEFSMDDWVTLDAAFDTTGTPELSSYTITLARIERIVVKDSLGQIADAIPSPADVLYEAAATEAASGDQVFHVGMTAVDPFMNDRGFRAPDFDLFWTTEPSLPETIAVGADTAPTTIGQNTVYYQTGAYTGICVPNSAVQRLGELGRVHSFQPSRSLRLWAASSSDENGSDASMLDVFKIGNQAQVAGRVNINTVQPDVLKALFTGALEVNVDSAVAAVLAKRAAGTVFTNVGQVFGTISHLSPSNTAQDAIGEHAAVRLAEKITTRSNYFTVIICAQAVKDVAGLPYRNAAGTTVTAAYGQLDVTNSGKLLDPVLSEQKMMAVVYRDALTNATRVERLEYLDE